jgi:hypothetical protein
MKVHNHSIKKEKKSELNIVLNFGLHGNCPLLYVIFAYVCVGPDKNGLEREMEEVQGLG